LSFLLLGVTHAQDATLDQARALMDRHDAAGAYALLMAVEPQRAGDADFDRLLGMAALDSGHLTLAIFAYERVLAARPDDNPARAELARAYLAAGERDNGQRELTRVRQAELPAQAAAAIDRVLNALKRVPETRGPRRYGYVEFSAGHDSNVNSATAAGQFAIPAFGGLLFTMAPESRRQRDLFMGAAGGAGVQVGLNPNWTLNAEANVRGTLNRHTHEMNTSVVDGTAGLSHTDGANTQSVALQANGAWVSGSVYRTAHGASAQWQSTLDAASQLSAFAQWSRLDYAGQSERDADRTVLGLGYAHSFEGTATLAYGSVFAANERARDSSAPYFGHHASGLRLGGEQRLGARSVAFLELQHEERRYGGTEPMFNLARRDRQTDAVLGLHFALASKWRLSPQLRYTRAASNIVFYDYSRTIVQLSLRRDFP
jgi:hypothetical protein